MKGHILIIFPGLLYLNFSYFICLEKILNCSPNYLKIKDRLLNISNWQRNPCTLGTEDAHAVHTHTHTYTSTRTLVPFPCHQPPTCPLHMEVRTINKKMTIMVIQKGASLRLSLLYQTSLDYLLKRRMFSFLPPTLSPFHLITHTHTHSCPRSR